MERFDNKPNDADLAAAVGACVRTLVPLLHEPHRRMLQLVELDGMNVNEAARVLGISVAHARVELHRARIVLRELLALSCAGCPHSDCDECTCDGCAAVSGGAHACH